MGLFPKDRDLTQAPEHVELAVDASAYGVHREELEIRLDQFLARHLKWRSRTSVQGLVKDGWVRVDASTPEHPRGSGVLVPERRPGRKLRHGSRVSIVIPPENRLPTVGLVEGELAVLYEDETLIALDKPAMLPVHPSGRHLSDTLIQRVHARLADEIARTSKAPRLCHRLDRETSGIVLVAKDPEVHRRMMRAFETRRVEKEYLAIVRGRPDAAHGRIEFPIGPARASRIGLKMAVSADGQPCCTEWWLEREAGDCSLVRCRLHTGRQHQIRVHLEAIGLPIVGDKLYGHDDGCFERAAEGMLRPADLFALELPRHALHNFRLRFVHPLSGAPIELSSPLPVDLAAWLDDRAGSGGELGG